MKVALLAGGRGTRLSEETDRVPKPMIEIGGKPILWHIMMHYSVYGHKDFAIALGYKSDYIKRWFVDMVQLSGDISVSTKLDLRPDFPAASGRIISRQQSEQPDWTVDLIETGLNTNTGGRIKQLERAIGRERFMLTWGDGVSNVDLDALLAFHSSHGKLATMTAVRPPARFGHLAISGDQITEFVEKPQASEGWINGAFFVLEPEVFEYIDGDDTAFEKAPLERLARDGELMAFRHEAFWQCMDTLHDKTTLEKIWADGNAPWATWA